MSTRDVALAVAWRTIRVVSRTPAFLVPTIVFPLFFFTAFAGGLSQVAQVPGFDYPNGYTAFQFAFVVLQSGAFGGVFTAFGVARDFEGGFGKRLLLASPNRLGIVLGYAIAGIARWGVVIVFLTVVALVAGMDVGANPAEIVGLYTLGLLFNIAGFMWAAGIAFRLRTVQAGPLMQMPVFLILFFAPVYVPLELLSGWIHGVARINPVTYGLEAARSLLAGEPTHVAAGLGLGLAFALALGVWGIRGLRSAERAV